MNEEPLASWAADLGAGRLRFALLTGPNGSGKSTITRLLAASLPAARVVSAETEQRFYEHELHEDDSDFQELPDAGTTVREILGDGADHPLTDALGLGQLLDRGYRQLSSGEARKTLLLQAVAGGSSILFLDEPFDGLDRRARADLWAALPELSRHLPIVLTSALEAHDEVTALERVGVCEAGKLAWSGSPEEWLIRPALLAAPVGPPPLDDEIAPVPPGEPLIRLRNGSVRYGDQVVFQGLDWTLSAGEHTLIEGPNGSGKSSLLQMVSGDHPQAYANDLELFGRRRGSGETVWDIKRNVGLLSGQLHRDYRVKGSALDVIVSGLFDSIGLYRAVEPSEHKRALRWWNWLEPSVDADTPFHSLSFGWQRLVLLCRAAIKLPPLLVLDEPTVGLDAENRGRVLGLVESLCRQSQSTVLFVSHRADDRRYWLERISSRLLTLPVGREAP